MVGENIKIRKPTSNVTSEAPLELHDQDLGALQSDSLAKEFLDVMMLYQNVS